jgi:ABC-type transport system involved in multi-copper enzyme maturation permease subunit
VTFLLWRQHRQHLAVAAAALAALAVLLLTTGVSLNGTYHSALATCHADGDCGSLGDSLFKTNWDQFLIVVVTFTIAVPALLGVFWGAPLVAREIEDGTIKLLFTQTVSRRRWFAAKAATMLAAGALWGAAIAALVIGHFDVQGIAPIGYAVFAVALGIACSAWIRRTLPAVAVSLTGFTAVRFAIAYGLRAHYLPPVVRDIPFGTHVRTGTGSAWFVSNTLMNPAGQSTGGRVDLHSSGCPIPAPGGSSATANCLARLGWHYHVAYQPSGRFWPFQGIETGIYLVLAAALVGAAYTVIVRRDA